MSYSKACWAERRQETGIEVKLWDPPLIQTFPSLAGTSSRRAGRRAARDGGTPDGTHGSRGGGWVDTYSKWLEWLLALYWPG